MARAKVVSKGVVGVPLVNVKKGSPLETVGVNSRLGISIFVACSNSKALLYVKAVSTPVGVTPVGTRLYFLKDSSGVY